MGKFYNVKLNGMDFNFHSDSRNTRNGFAHDCELEIKNGNNTFGQYNAKCNYLNRTWECFTFQSVMLSALRDAIDTEKAYVQRQFMEKNDFAKLTKSRKATLELEYGKDNEIVTMQNVYNYLKDYDSLNMSIDDFMKK